MSSLKHLGKGKPEPKGLPGRIGVMNGVCKSKEDQLGCGGDGSARKK